jgi:anti-sigma factor RsiW
VSAGCPHAEHLSAFLDGELAVAERAALEAHLAVHDACRRELAEVQAVRDAVRRLPRVEGPADFWAELAVRIATVPADPDRAPVAATPIAVRRAGGATPTWLWGAAAAAVLLVAGGLAGTQVDRSAPPATAEPSGPVSTVRVQAEPFVVVSGSSGPPVGQQLVTHNDGVDDAMDGVTRFLRMP